MPTDVPLDPSAPPPTPPLPIAPHAPLGDYYTGDKRPFVREMFDVTAANYDRVERLMALGSGSWYRRRALQRAGLRPGMRAIDVATGTGLVAREAVALVGPAGKVIGVDPSRGMLAESRRTLGIPAVLGVGERLPLADAAFDFLSMGYALRHLPDLAAAFGEYFRVLRPGGRVCILEMTLPENRLKRAMVKFHMRRVVPTLSRLLTRHRQTQVLWQYYWDTIEACVPPESVLSALRAAGFRDVGRHVELGMFSEYTGTR